MRVQSDLCSALDSGAIAVLVLLDLSAAFDTLDILLNRFRHTFAISGSALDWISSYQRDRYQAVIIDK